MKIKVREIGLGLCKDDNGNVYVGIANDKVMDIENGELFDIDERNENDEVISIKNCR